MQQCIKSQAHICWCLCREVVMVCKWSLRHVSLYLCSFITLMYELCSSYKCESSGSSKMITQDLQSNKLHTSCASRLLENCFTFLLSIKYEQLYIHMQRLQWHLFISFHILSHSLSMRRNACIVFRNTNLCDKGVAGTTAVGHSSGLCLIMMDDVIPWHCYFVLSNTNYYDQ